MSEGWPVTKTNREEGKKKAKYECPWHPTTPSYPAHLGNTPRKPKTQRDEKSSSCPHSHEAGGAVPKAPPPPPQI